MSEQNPADDQQPRSTGAGDHLLIQRNTLPLSPPTAPPPPPTDEEREEQWKQAEVDFQAWRTSGATVDEFNEKTRTSHQYDAEFKFLDGNIWACQPGWENEWERHRRERQALYDGLDAGRFAFQAIRAAGLDWPPELATLANSPHEVKEKLEKAEETEKRNVELEQIIEAGRRENADQKRRIKELEREVALWMRRASEAQRQR